MPNKKGKREKVTKSMLELICLFHSLELSYTPITIMENSLTWEHSKLTSGLVAYRTEFEENDQKGVKYQLKCSECRFKIYGEETTQIDEILQSINIISMPDMTHMLRVYWAGKDIGSYHEEWD